MHRESLHQLPLSQTLQILSAFSLIEFIRFKRFFYIFIIINHQVCNFSSELKEDRLRSVFRGEKLVLIELFVKAFARLCLLLFLRYSRNTCCCKREFSKQIFLFYAFRLLSIMSP